MLQNNDNKFIHFYFWIKYVNIKRYRNHIEKFDIEIQEYRK